MIGWCIFVLFYEARGIGVVLRLGMHTKNKSLFDAVIFQGESKSD
jgi:hypothetical protein